MAVFSLRAVFHRPEAGYILCQVGLKNIFLLMQFLNSFGSVLFPLQQLGDSALEKFNFLQQLVNFALDGDKRIVRLVQLDFRLRSFPRPIR